MPMLNLSDVCLLFMLGMQGDLTVNKIASGNKTMVESAIGADCTLL